MRGKFIGLLLITLLITSQQLVNCQSEDDDGGDGRSFEGDVEESNQDGSGNKQAAKKVTDGELIVDAKKQTEAKLAEQEDLRPKSHFTEDRFTQLFVPRNSRRKLVSARYTTKPKPTLPSFIKKPISVPPPDFEAPAPRGSSSSSSSSQSSSSSSSRSRTTSTTTTTPRPGRGRGRGSTTSTTSTTESSYRRGVFSTRKPANKLFPNRNRN
ncbi:differentiation-associated protein 1-like [Panonychus citri]|uniref:differentiation-associated protein 1-like n=1 Tax=Panonychus citri TaxID=50023 RepID=UPI00230743C0|nr:differentiation-associated protein 1-like [Panonychus citri]